VKPPTPEEKEAARGEHWDTFELENYTTHYGFCVNSDNRRPDKSLETEHWDTKSMTGCRELCDKDPECVAFYMQSRMFLCSTFKADPKSAYQGRTISKCFIRSGDGYDQEDGGCYISAHN
jgi:hypothetical protein